MQHIQALILLAGAFRAVTAASTSDLKPSYPSPIAADGWSAQLVAQGLVSPRGILFDSKSNLLVVQQGNGIVHLQFSGTTLANKTTLVESTSVRIISTSSVWTDSDLSS